jgi:hypothetical protein
VIQVRSRSNLPSILDASRQLGILFFDRLSTAADVGSEWIPTSACRASAVCRVAFVEALPIERSDAAIPGNEQAQ